MTNEKLFAYFLKLEGIDIDDCSTSYVRGWLDAADWLLELIGDSFDEKIITTKNSNKNDYDTD